MPGFYKDSENVYRAAALDAFPWLVHGFGTRLSPNLGTGAALVTLHQIHSDIVIEPEGRVGRIGDGDALISDTPGVFVAVKTADCVPLLMVDPANRAVAAVHAGWRGTVKKIAQHAVAAMQRKFSTRVQDLHVAIGPAIGSCCYEVGPEVAAQFREFDPSLGDITHPTHLDLAGYNRAQLLALGVHPAHVYMAGLCTKCNHEFHSYRRDKQHAGRMHSMAGIR